MTKQTLVEAIERLSVRRAIFHSEADFQFALAWELQRNHLDWDVRLEYSPQNRPEMHIDIVVFAGGYVYPVELKYKTKKIKCVVEGEVYALKEQGAQDCGRYDFVKDIVRVEEMEGLFRNYGTGYTLLLTNDLSYCKIPRQNITGTNCYQFRLHQGNILQGVRDWSVNTGAGTKGTERIAPLNLRGRYTMLWKDYSRLSDEPGCTFRYLLLEVEKEKTKC